MKFAGLERAVGAALLAVALSGCRHKVVQATLPPQVLPQPVAPDPPLVLSPPMVASAPPDLKPQEAPKVVVKKPRVAKKKAAPVQVPAVAGTQVAAAGGGTGAGTSAPATTAESSPIGALSPGGDAGPQARKEAGDAIAEVAKRIEGLGPEVAQKQRAHVNKVRQFLREAQKALDSGDAEGAKTLAVKAKLLLDEVTK